MIEELAEFTYKSKYAKYLPEKNRREEWHETVYRCRDMHLQKYDFLSDDLKDKVKESFEAVVRKECTPSMRSLQFGGEAILRKEARMFNCSVAHIYNSRSIEKAFWLLLCGCGVGLGLTRKYASQFPRLVKRGQMEIVYVVPDTIEGWANSVKVLIDSYTEGNEYSGFKIKFDYSQIREKGAPLSIGGKAPGPDGLKNAHEKIQDVLESSLENGYLSSLDLYDICMHCSDAVLSGGIRRSATIVLFDLNDEEMMAAKTDLPVKVLDLRSLDLDNYVLWVEYRNKKRAIVNLPWFEIEKAQKEGKMSWFRLEPQRARSNNSVMLKRDSVTKEKFQDIFQHTKQFGEPGFIFVDSEDTLVNPCFTVDTKILTIEGWRTFEELINSEIEIIQDRRFKGKISTTGEEVWDYDLRESGTTTNLATKIRKTAEKQNIFKVTTTCGREIKATGNHHFATNRGMVTLDNLSLSDRMMVPLPDPYESDTESIEFKAGFLSGLISGDGTTSNDGTFLIDLWVSDNDNVLNEIEGLVQEVSEYFGYVPKTNGTTEPKFSKCVETESYTKYRLSSVSLTKALNSFGFYNKHDFSILYRASKDFKSGFISGLIYADGCVEYNSKKEDLSLRVTNTSKENLTSVMLTLQELGVFSALYDGHPSRMSQLPNGKGGKGEYMCKATYRLSINGITNLKNSLKFLKILGPKNNKLQSILNTSYGYKKTRTTTGIKSIEFFGVEDVYCLSEDVNRTLIAEGVTARRCAEISFIPVHDGEPAVQFCNLSIVNGNKVKTKEQLMEAVKNATIIGTLQAGYTKFDFLDKKDEDITKKEALLGVSIMGFLANPELLTDPSVLQEASALAVKVNEEWSEYLGINKAARVTCVKPDGNSSTTLGSPFAGVHPAHSHKYIRRVQVNKEEAIYNHFKKFNPQACEQSVYSANNTDDVISFPIEFEGGVTKDHLTALEHLDIIKTVQTNWVDGGAKNNKIPTKNSVSCTVLVGEDEWEDVSNYIFDHKEDFSTVSLLPRLGDKLYDQAPYEKMETEEELEQFYKLKNSFTKVDYTTLVEEDDNTNRSEELACAGGACLI